MATGLILVPEQSAMLLGATILASGLVMVAAPSVIQVRSWSLRKDVTVFERIVRFATSAGLGLMFAISGALVAAGRT